MSTVAPGSTAPVLSTTVVSMRPVDTCAIDRGGATAPYKATSTPATTSVAIRLLISILPDRRPIELHNRTVDETGQPTLWAQVRLESKPLRAGEHEGAYLAKRSKMSTSSERRCERSGSPLFIPSGTHFSTWNLNTTR